MPLIPWADISAFPHNFYDTDRFKFPVALRSPDLYEAVDIYSVTKYLMVLASTKTPFRFRSKEDITGLTAKQTNAVIEDLTAGEDCDADEAISNIPRDDQPPSIPTSHSGNKPVTQSPAPTNSHDALNLTPDVFPHPATSHASSDVGGIQNSAPACKPRNTKAATCQGGKTQMEAPPTNLPPLMEMSNDNNSRRSSRKRKEPERADKNVVVKPSKKARARKRAT